MYISQWLKLDKINCWNVIFLPDKGRLKRVTYWDPYRLLHINNLEEKQWQLVRNSSSQ
jgi:hypothetical protein